jgi:phosphoketolase
MRPDDARSLLLADLERRVDDAVQYAREHFEDAPEIRDWRWTSE